MKLQEHQIQRAFFDEINMMANSEPRLVWCHATMNGAIMSVKHRVISKLLGMKKGVWDVFIPELFLWIEFKVKGNPLTKEQKEFREALKHIFKFEVCYSASEGVEVVKKLLRITKPNKRYESE